ncbi:hypothetical protein [Actinomadura opuntiae]|uniref:hypothetical protein n=1 Tax=Actinomadura sp. OS1-43 TaxID=604315 RepID=UPI00255ADCBC|nr:hypothetical protein [Actinomadura sp. OS1-43]MDL4814958.1 hypothetical protein [Actinomadura sp. OS1-43]
MASGERRLDKLSELHFRGQVGRAVAEYAKGTQRFAHDMAAELDTSAEAARSAMWKVRKQVPTLRVAEVWVRAKLVSRHLKRARDLCQGISAEAVKFNITYRREFLDIDDRGGRHHGGGDVSL